MAQAKAKHSRNCGTCLFYSWWTGDCCKDGDFREVHPEHKPCSAYEYEPEETDSDEDDYN